MCSSFMLFDDDQLTSDGDTLSYNVLQGKVIAAKAMADLGAHTQGCENGSMRHAWYTYAYLIL